MPSFATLNDRRGGTRLMSVLKLWFALAIGLGLLMRPLQAEFVYVTNVNDNTVSAFSIALDGTLNAVQDSPFPAGSSPSSVAVDSLGHFAYVANRGDGTVNAYSINQTTGALTQVAGSPAGPNLNSVAVDGRRGRFVYVTAASLPSVVFAYQIGLDGGLTDVPGSPFPLPSPFDRASGMQLIGSATSVAVDSSGRFAYVTGFARNGRFSTVGLVFAYSIDQATGVLTPIAGSPSIFGSPLGDAFSVAIDPMTQFVYVGSQRYGVFAFQVDRRSGALTSVAGSPFPAGQAVSVTVDRLGRFVYVADPSSNSVSAYRINQGTGALTPVAGSPFPAGASPSSVAVDFTDQFAYVANFYDGTVSAYRIDQTSGALTPLGEFQTGSGPNSVAISSH